MAQDLWLVPSDDLLSEQGHLVASGVRPLALVGHCAPHMMSKARARLERFAPAGAHALCVQRDGEVADYGYVAAEWVGALYHWLVTSDAVTDDQRHRIIGLLLGYSVEAISAFRAAASLAPTPT